MLKYDDKKYHYKVKAFGTKWKLLAIIWMVLIEINACGQLHGVANSNGSEGSDPSDDRQGSGYLLFQTNQSTAELSASKKTFLQTTCIQQHPSRADRYSVNTSLGPGPSFQPKSPIVHTYNGLNALVPLAVSLTKSFRWNIPQSIRHEISKCNIDELDILFTPQEEIRAADDSLKAAYWMFPSRPPLDQILGSPPEYQKTILLGLFDSDHFIDDQVISNQLREFKVSLHDQKISPDTGHINTAAAPAGSFAFYSVAIFDEQRRAAVTLHWILTRADREALINMLRETQAAGAVNTFEAFIHHMNAPGSPFHQTSIIKKLMDLVSP